MAIAFVYVFYSFFGTFFLGLTAVFLKLADVDNVYYGLIIRALASGPIILILVFILHGFSTIIYLGNLLIILLLCLASLFLMGADILIMAILKRKPIGLIAPLIAIFPLFTSIMLILTGFIPFSSQILGFTMIIVIGVGMVTYNRSNNQNPLKRSFPFDKEALGYGLLIAIFLGLTNYMDIVIISSNPLIDGISYTSFKFMILLILSTIAFLIVGHRYDDWKAFQSNRKSTFYLSAAGFCAWALGSVFIYTSYNQSDPAIVNAIIGMNPVFAVLISITLKLEELNKFKIAGLLLCVLASIGIVNL